MVNETAILGELVPIIAIVMGIGIAMLGMWLDYRKKSEFLALHHKERLAAIEKGLDVPPLPPELFQRHGRAPADCLRRGLVWLAIGAAVTAALMIEEHRGAAYGLIPAAIGLANLLYYYLQPRVPVAPKA
jgi:hypothetical protein